MKITRLAIPAVAFLMLLACGDKIDKIKEGAAGVVQVATATTVKLTPPFDEMHALMCKERKSKLTNEDSIRSVELLTQAQNLQIKAMASNDAARVQEVSILMLRAADTETCK